MFKLFKKRKKIALTDAAEEGDLKKGRKLLDKGADVNAKDEYGDTALIRASAEEGDLKKVRKLLDKGADVNAKGEYGNTGIHYKSQGKMHNRII